MVNEKTESVDNSLIALRLIGKTPCRHTRWRHDKIGRVPVRRPSQCVDLRPLFTQHPGMTLDELTTAAAETLGHPLAEIKAIAAALAGAGVICHGLHQDRPLPVSALTNLLLGVLSRSSVEEVGLTVSRFREAVVEPTRDAHAVARPIMDHRLFTQRHSLGEALDTILLSYAADDDFDDEAYGLPITNMSLTVHSPQIFNYSAELWLDNGSEDWTLRYHRNHPEFDTAPEDTRADVARRLMAGRGDMSFTAAVSSTTFYELADAFGRTAGQQADEQLTHLFRRKG